MNPYLRLLLMVSAVALAYRGCGAFNAYWYEGFLPSSLDVEDVVLVDSSSDFREGCGVAIYKLNQQTLASIQADGLAALKQARTPKGHPNRGYGEWRETPSASFDAGPTKSSWLSGFAQGCADVPTDMSQKVHAALRAPGSFYAVDRESGLLIIPKLGWVVLSHLG